uniref:Nif11 domain-containing protein n=1 Tax=Panagrolaimus sp. ES5 TaxID=591445 RepID=A0AC34G4R7_9BILA
MDILSKLSLTFGIEDAIKEFKATDSDFQQQLKNSGIQYAGTFEEAKEAFDLPLGITEEQAHFLLSNRS